MVLPKIRFRRVKTVKSESQAVVNSIEKLIKETREDPRKARMKLLKSSKPITSISEAVDVVHKVRAGFNSGEANADPFHAQQNFARCLKIVWRNAQRNRSSQEAIEYFSRMYAAASKGELKFRVQPLNKQANIAYKKNIRFVRAKLKDLMNKKMGCPVLPFLTKEMLERATPPKAAKEDSFFIQTSDGHKLRLVLAEGKSIIHGTVVYTISGHDLVFYNSEGKPIGARTKKGKFLIKLKENKLVVEKFS